jgi:2-amino-4-hydroxy-6-hydroxymethyldihydropteridine diphosphokinase
MAAQASVFIGLGSNQGDREATLARGLRALGDAGLRLRARSSLYLTEPVDAPPQDWFVNAVAVGETSLAPDALLAACLAAERAEGRLRTVHHGPRTLDLDILFYGGLVQDDPALTIPHPRLHERRFVLVPLHELAPDLRHPRLHATVDELLRRCPDRSRVVRLHAGADARP